MDTLKTIISGTRTKASNNYNTDLFKSDREVIEDYNQLPNMYDNFLVIKKDDNSTDRFGKDVQTQIIASDSEDLVYIINCKETAYNNQLQVSCSTQEVTLQGFHYFTKLNEKDELLNLTNAMLRQNKIDACFSDILGVMELNTEYNVYQYEYETEKDKVWITADINGHLKKVTRKPISTKAHTSTTQSSVLNMLGI